MLELVRKRPVMPSPSKATMTIRTTRRTAPTSAHRRFLFDGDCKLFTKLFMGFLFEAIRSTSAGCIVRQFLCLQASGQARSREVSTSIIGHKSAALRKHFMGRKQLRWFRVSKGLQRGRFLDSGMQAQRGFLGVRDRKS